MATVELRFAPLPEHVRTARLVATALARRAGVDDSLLDEVRLAVGEACTRAVGLHRAHHSDAPVTVSLDDGEDRFSVQVIDAVLADENAASHPHEVVDGTVDAALGPWADGTGDMGLAVISGLVDDLDVGVGDQGGIVRMSWPAGEASRPTVSAGVVGGAPTR